jgi:hypothetical protein
VLRLSALTMPPVRRLAGGNRIRYHRRRKPDFSPEDHWFAQKDRRQFSKSEREVPRRRAIHAIIRDRLPPPWTILSFSPSVQPAGLNNLLN